MKFKENFAKFKKIPKKLKKYLKNPLDSKDISVLKKLSFEVLVFGIMSNYVFWVLFRLPFTWYSWIGYGFAIFLIERKLIIWIRRIIFRV